ncbi:hypothetical protein GCM10011613_22250 [Cellvibrio zantedeschiae]|uniref:DUF2884 family protein n=1 Tax=Cellvibrio zantedeschiae TaxID=1237077 RepID=A0ABQ3B375_9GAMM|nr:DUF2884 family protein [Cellvibrio zantedeschiae]GGY77264.1 hypothetical protein GCM10011613_22250 [Cellvibrio zantedeschiae]
MKALVVALAWLFSVVAYAKDGCSLEFEGGLHITKDALSFTEGDKTRFTILNNQQLLVNGRAVALDEKQQLLVKQYANDIRALVPEVRVLTLEGVDLAAQAMDLAFQELLEPGDQTRQQVNAEFALLKRDVEKGFSDGRAININQKGFKDRDFLGMDFESRISKIVETSTKDLSWSAVKNFLSSLFSDDNPKGDFETRMKKFGERMDREMKGRSEKLSQRSDKICVSVIALDRKEEEMRKSIKEIDSFNLIKLKSVPSKSI